MALLRSGRRTSISSGSSIVSFQSYETARSAGQEDAPTTNGLTIQCRKRARKALSINSDAKEGRACFPAASTLIKNSDEDLKKILIEGKSSVRCLKCNALGTLSPVGKAGPAGTYRWKCGARAGEPGCKKTCAQVVVLQAP